MFLSPMSELSSQLSVMTLPMVNCGIFRSELKSTGFFLFHSNKSSRVVFETKRKSFRKIVKFIVDLIHTSLSPGPQTDLTFSLWLLLLDIFYVLLYYYYYSALCSNKFYILCVPKPSLPSYLFLAGHLG